MKLLAAFAFLLLLIVDGLSSQESRIFGGFETPVDAFPWVVSLRFFNPPGQSAPVPLCAGSILSEIFVLTAASCFSGAEALTEFFSIQAGVHDRTNVNASNEQIRSITHVIVHPKYNASRLLNDLALVRVFPPFNFTPSNVASLSLTNVTNLNGSDLIAVGWGILNQSNPTVGATGLHQVTVQEDWQCTAEKAIDPNTQLCATGEKTILCK